VALTCAVDKKGVIGMRDAFKGCYSVFSDLDNK